MTAGSRVVLVSALAVVTVVALVVITAALWRRDGETPEQQRAEIAALEKERASLRLRLDEWSGRDPRTDGMPDTSVRIGIPTSLATDLIQRFTTGFVDRVTLELKNITVRKRGRITRVVTIGDYELRITINRVTARLKTGRPTVTFGDNRIGLAVPVQVVSGNGRATINFVWDGKNISGALCGDQDITLIVTGNVKPARYPIAGAVVLSADSQRLLAEPVFPLIRVNLKVNPAAESWAAAQKVLDDRRGVCGFVLDKADILGNVRALVDKGFTVRIPTEKIKPVAVPVGIHPSMQVRGRTVALGIKLSTLTITKTMIWLGSDVTAGGVSNTPSGR